MGRGTWGHVQTAGCVWCGIQGSSRILDERTSGTTRALLEETLHYKKIKDMFSTGNA